MHATFVETLSAAARNHPERPFIWGASESVSLAEFAGRCARVAGGLAGVGLKRGEVVALMLPNRAEWLEVFFGAMILGARVAPIHPDYRPDEVERIIADCRAAVLVTDLASREMAARLFDDCVSLRRAIIVEDAGAPGAVGAEDLLDAYAEVASADPISQPTELSADETLSLTYTSGSTGAPRGVLLSHANYLSTARDVCEALEINSEDRILCCLPLYHVGAQVLGPLAALLGGAQVVMSASCDLQDLPETLERTGATIVQATPGLLDQAIGRVQARDSTDTAEAPAARALRLAVTMGGPIDPHAARAFERHFKAALVATYGLTEGCGVSAIWSPKPAGFALASNPDAIHHTPIGSPLSSQQIRVAAPSPDAPSPGAVGELLIRGPNLMQGYAGDEAASALAICDGWLRTGDVGFADSQGVFYLVGRKKELVIRGDAHVYPEEIDEVLLRHPAVAAAGTMGIDDAERGQMLVAFVALAADRLVTGEDLLAYCAEYLAPYKCPDRIELRDALPTTPTGQVRKGLLAKNYRASP